MSKHSPGPWYACGEKPGGMCKCGLVWSTTRDYTVATVRHKDQGEGEPDVPTAEYVANMALIASAPTLAARLDEAVGLLRKVRDLVRPTADEMSEDPDESICPRCGVVVQVLDGLEAEPGDMCHPCCATAVSEARALLAAIDAQGTESAGGT